MEFEEWSNKKAEQQKFAAWGASRPPSVTDEERRASGEQADRRQWRKQGGERVAATWDFGLSAAKATGTEATPAGGSETASNSPASGTTSTYTKPFTPTGQSARLGEMNAPESELSIKSQLRTAPAQKVSAQTEITTAPASRRGGITLHPGIEEVGQKAKTAQSQAAVTPTASSPAEKSQTQAKAPFTPVGQSARQGETNAPESSKSEENGLRAAPGTKIDLSAGIPLSANLDKAKSAEQKAKNESYRAIRTGSEDLTASHNWDAASKAVSTAAAAYAEWWQGVKEETLATYAKAPMEAASRGVRLRDDPYQPTLASLPGADTKQGGLTRTDNKYQYMSEAERQIYNYWQDRNPEAAKDYLNILEETLNARIGVAHAKSMRDSDRGTALGAVNTGLYGFGAGVDQFAGGIGQLFSSERLPTSAAQFGSAYVRNDLADSGPKFLGSSLGQIGYDMTTTAGNMAPSILLSYLTAGVATPAALTPVIGSTTMSSAIGSTVLGLSAGGNAYNSALQQGYSKGQAATYGTLIGISEGGLQYLMGGIKALSGTGGGKIAAKITGIDNACLKLAANLAVSSVKEAAEEGLQSVLDAVFRSTVFKEELNINFNDVAYSALLGALSGGLFEGVAQVTANGRGGTAALETGMFSADTDGYLGNGGRDYFAGVDDVNELGKTYRELAKQNHPDVGGQNSVMSDIDRQYDMKKAYYTAKQLAASTGPSSVEAGAWPEQSAQAEPSKALSALSTSGTDETISTLYNNALAMQDNRAYTGEKGTGVLNGTAFGQGLSADGTGDALRTHPLGRTALELASRNQANGQSGTVPPWSQGYGTQAAQGAGGSGPAIGRPDVLAVATEMLGRLANASPETTSASSEQLNGESDLYESRPEAVPQLSANSSNAGTEGAGDGLSSKIYTPVEYKGTVKVNGEVKDVSRRVYQRNDINTNYYDETTGLTNLERMQAGKPPIGTDGNPVELHHVLQQEAGPMAELREITHQQYYSQLHGLVENGASFRNNPLLNKQYNNFRYNYWKWRASLITGGK